MPASARSAPRDPVLTAEIVNLRQARKARARRDAQGAAAGNRAKFGRTAGEKTSEAAEGARRDRLLDGAKLED
jgi:hypothetical protein